MRFYRTDAPFEGTHWFATKAEAERAAKAAGTRFALVDVPDAKDGKLAWLNAHAVPGAAVVTPAEPPHDNLAGVSPAERDAAERAERGIPEAAHGEQPDGIWLPEGNRPDIHDVVPEEFHGLIAPATPAQVPYSIASTELDAAFSRAPLAQRLTLAALALEDARQSIKP